MKEYDIVYSIGRDCANSTFLKKRGLRVTSGPFDWLTKADFETRIQLICQDFVDFLNKDDLQIREKPTHVVTDTACDSYENTRTGFYFYHDFPAGVPLDESYPLVKEKYDRRIARFLKKVQEEERVLLVWFSHEPTVNKLDVKTLCDAVCKRFNKRIDFLLIEHDENVPKGEWVHQSIADNIEYYTLFTQKYDSNGALTTFGREEAIFPIYTRYTLPGLEERMRRKKTRKRIGRILSMLLPVRSWRKRIRDSIKNYLLMITIVTPML